MISHLHSTTVVVSDQDRALEFYVDTLGWEKGFDARLSDEMRYVTVVPPGAATQLALGVPGWFEGRAPGGNTGIALSSPDIDATYETLKGRGVRFKEPVSMMPWGAKATWFYDPDGNEFFLAEG